MKKILGLLLITLICISCNSDDDATTLDNNDDANANNDIVGTFMMTAFYFFNSDFNGDGIISANSLVEIPCIEVLFTFNSDNTFSYRATNFEVGLDPNGIELANCEETYTEETGTYLLNGNSLRLNTITSTDLNADTDDNSSSLTLNALNDTGSDVDSDSNNILSIIKTEKELTLITDNSDYGKSVIEFKKQ